MASILVVPSGSSVGYAGTAVTQQPSTARFDEAAGLSLRAPQGLDRKACSELEWVTANGHGGYATGTVSGEATRRYHGLLVTPLPGSSKRYCLVGHLNESVSGGHEPRQLDRISASGNLAPGPLAQLLSFELLPWPTWTYAVEGVQVTREVLVDTECNRTLVRWSSEASAAALTLEVAPYLPFREADDLTFTNAVLRPETRTLEAKGWSIRRCLQPYLALPALGFAFQAEGTVDWQEDPHWLRGIELARDLARGYDGHEDRFSPGRARFSLQGGGSAIFCAGIDHESAQALTMEPGLSLWNRLADRARSAWQRASTKRSSAAALQWRAADAFLYSTLETSGEPEPQRLGILAGFPWFGEWGRDVFLSLPGLTLSRGRVEDCQRVLLGALPFLQDGLLPNIYGTTIEDSHYGSVDASLWFARAVRLFRVAGGDPELCRGALRSALGEIHRAYASGTALGVRADGEGLIAAGGPHLNPTWMDAQTSKGPVTPRAGCPVEIAALWILLLAERLELEGAGRTKRVLASELVQAQETFRKRFWNAQRGYLADLWTPTHLDVSLRPNMVLAAAMDTTPLKSAEKERLLDRAERELVTSLGLRTLSPQDPAYRPRYAGGPEERDQAYHQGTIWPWLLGSYVELCLQARPDLPGERARLASLLDRLDLELLRAGLGHLSEVYDGDAPHHPGGTMAQAWNTAELLRARALLEAAHQR